MGLTAPALVAVLLRCAAAADAAAPELNALDGQLGDGDLGATLQKCARNLQAALAEPQTQTQTQTQTQGEAQGEAGDLGDVMKAAALACTKASGSSFGTLLAVAFMTAAKRLAGQAELPWTELPPLLAAVLEALMSRGKASLGDKTVLDPLEAVRAATEGLSDPAEQGRRALAAVETTLEAFRGKPNRIGRARMFADRSVGMDDPGMVAFDRLVRAATGA